MENVGKRCVRNEQDARELLMRWAQTGEPLGEWSKRNGVVRQSLQWWRGRVGATRSEDRVTVRLAEVVLPEEAPATEATYRVRLANGREVVVDERFDGDVLARLLNVVDP